MTRTASGPDRFESGGENREVKEQFVRSVRYLMGGRCSAEKISGCLVGLSEVPLFYQERTLRRFLVDGEYLNRRFITRAHDQGRLIYLMGLHACEHVRL